MVESDMHSAEHRRIGLELAALPDVPRAVLDLTTLDAGALTFAEEVARIAETNPRVADEVLRIASLRPPRPPEPIDSIAEAVVQLGSRAVAELTASLLVVRIFPATSPEHVALWRHANQVAVIAQDIAEDRSIGIDPQAAYLAGLLHDVGRFLLFERDPQELVESSASDWPSPQSLIAAERLAFGVQHAEVGASACRHWNLPLAVCELVRLHHTLVVSNEVLPDQVVRCLPIVQQADHLSSLLMREPHLIARPFSERRALVAAHCMRTCGAPASTATRLAERLDVVVGRSNELLRDLGLGARADSR